MTAAPAMRVDTSVRVRRRPRRRCTTQTPSAAKNGVRNSEISEAANRATLFSGRTAARIENPGEQEGHQIRRGQEGDTDLRGRVLGEIGVGKRRDGEGGERRREEKVPGQQSGDGAGDGARLRPRRRGYPPDEERRDRQKKMTQVIVERERERPRRMSPVERSHAIERAVLHERETRVELNEADLLAERRGLRVRGSPEQHPGNEGHRDREKHHRGTGGEEQ